MPDYDPKEWILRQGRYDPLPYLENPFSRRQAQFNSAAAGKPQARACEALTCAISARPAQMRMFARTLGPAIS